MSAAKGVEVIKAVKHFLATTKAFEQCLNKVSLVCGGEGRMVAEFTVGSEHLNRRGGLHGGFVATLVDAVSTYALRTHLNGQEGGVSIDMHISYLSTAKEGDRVEVEASTLRAGRSMAFLKVEVRNKDNNALIATGNHTKYLG